MFADTERRIQTGFVPECRETPAGKFFVGRAVVYDSLSQPIYGMFVEKFKRDAFDKHLATNPDVVATIDHDYGRLLGRTASGTLKLDADDQGIGVSVSQSDTTIARDLAIMLGRKDIRGMSFIFECVDDQWEYDEKLGMRLRTVTSARIHEVSFVTFPAYPDTEAGVRSARSLAEKHPIPNYDIERRRLRLLDAEN